MKIKSEVEIMDNDEVVYLTEKEINEIAELKTINAAIDYIEDMPEKKKQLAMKLFDKEATIRILQTVIAERY